MALTDKLTAIADAIRAKTGSTAKLTLEQMPTEIAGIETDIPDGYIIPTGSVNITANGTFDVTEKASAVVNVPVPDGYIIPSGSKTITANGEYDITEKASVKVEVPEPEITLQNKEITENGTYTADDGYDGLGQVTVNVPSSGGDADEIMDAIVARSFTTFSSDATKIGDYALAGCASLTEVNFPNATSTGKNSFAYCNGLTSVDFPSLTSIGNQSFFNCAALVSVNFPKVTTLAVQSVSYCDKLTKIVLPKVTRVAQNAFTYNRGLKIIDLPSATNIVTGAFSNCTVLTALVLRSTTLCTLGNTAAFTNCYHLLGTTNATYNPNGDKDGYIYVPRALVDTYKTASNWSTYASQFRALEDYTVDGTITGEFSENGPEGGLLDSNGNYLYDILQNKLITKEE